MSGHPCQLQKPLSQSSFRLCSPVSPRLRPVRAPSSVSGSNCRCMMIGCSCAARVTCRQGVQKRLKDSLRAAGSRSCNPLATEVIPIAERIETPASSTWPIWRPPDSLNRPVMADFAPRRTHRLKKIVHSGPTGPSTSRGGVWTPPCQSQKPPLRPPFECAHPCLRASCPCSRHPERVEWPVIDPHCGRAPGSPSFPTAHRYVTVPAVRPRSDLRSLPRQPRRATKRSGSRRSRRRSSRRRTPPQRGPRRLSH